MDVPPQIDRYCPVTGLPVVQKTQWNAFRCSPDMTMSYLVVGGRIVVSCPQGYSTSAGIDKALEVRSQVIASVRSDKLPWVALIDCAGVSGVSNEARKQFLYDSSALDTLAAVFFFNISPHLKIGIELGLRLRAPDQTVEICSGYSGAVQRACEILAQRGGVWESRLFDRGRQQPPVMSRLIPFEVAHHADWEGDFATFRSRTQIIDGAIAHTVISGHLREAHVEPMIRLSRMIYDAGPETNQPPGGAAPTDIQYFAVDSQDLINVSRGARLTYMRSLIVWHARRPIRLFVLYGLNRYLRAAIYIAQAFLPFRVEVTKDLAHALDLIRRDRDSQSPRSGIAASKTPELPLQQDAESLLAFVGTLQWDQPGIASEISISKESPLYPVFEALRLVKGELDDMLAQHQRDECSLRASEKRYRELFEKGSDLIWLHTPDGNVINSNLTFKKEYGWARDEAVGVNIKTLLSDRFRTLFSYYIKRVLKAGNDKGRARLMTKSGQERIIEYRSELVDNLAADQPLIKCTAVDITDQLIVQKKNQDLQEQLHHKQKLETVGALTGGIAHDFNTILGIVMGNADLALEDLEESHSAWESVAEIKTTALQAKSVVQQLLRFSRASQVKPIRLEVDRFMEESVPLLRALIPRHIAFEKRIGRAVWAIRADAGQMHQVLLNLVVNALQAMSTRRNGRLELRLSNQELVHTRDGFPHAVAPGQYVQMAVADTGVGMAREVIKRIFEPYFSTKAVGQGSGLGLSVLQGIIRSHQGHVQVESTVGAGTCFKLFFPAMRTLSTQTAPHNSFGRVRGTERIFLVDDQQRLVDVWRRQLSRLGYQVTAHVDPRRALDAIRQKPDHIDVLVSDYQLPEMDGLQLVQQVSQIRPGLPAILCTGIQTQIDPAALRTAGIHRLVFKPTQRNELAVVIRELLDGTSGSAGTS